jgi:hypothetical protein
MDCASTAAPSPIRSGDAPLRVRFGLGRFARTLPIPPESIGRHPVIGAVVDFCNTAKKCDADL